jgi:hypothetical protein
MFTIVAHANFCGVGKKYLDQGDIYPNWSRKLTLPCELMMKPQFALLYVEDGQVVWHAPSSIWKTNII